MVKITSIILIIILLAALGYSSYYLYQNLPGSPKELIAEFGKGDINMENGKNQIPNENETEIISFPSGEMQFYPGMRFSKLPISYSISSQCSEEKAENIDNAVQILEQETNLIFEKLNNEGQILVRCQEISNREIEKQEFFVAGEGGPTEIVNTTLHYVILKGEILLLRESDCTQPLIALHEMLHVLGFDHSQNKMSIMYNVSNCQQKLTKDIINEINRLSSISSLPDLYFSNITATKSGRYLSFEVEIRNRGLATSNSTTIAIYAAGDEEEQKIDSFDVNEMDVGDGIFLKVENVRLPSRATDEIKFVIDTENKIAELDEENNIAILRTE